MAKRDYNLIVIGAGAAGLTAAYIGSTLKARVALVEKNRMGGDCLNSGCVPSKALLRTAKILSYIRRHREFGIASAEAETDFALALERVREAVRRVAPHDSAERYSALGVECLSGEARVLSPDSVSVNGRTLTASNLIIATGARPLVPSIPGLEATGFLTTDTVWDLRDKPHRLLVAGGGPVGCELAQAFARLGCRVTLVEMADHLLPREDGEFGQALAREFSREEIDVRVGTALKSVAKNGGTASALIESGDGQSARVEFDRLLLALGRSPNTRGFGLEEAGVRLTPRDTVAVDDCMRTNVAGIYACGDVAGPYQLTHAAAHQAWHCAVNALFRPFKKFRVDYRVIPWCAYSDPEVARVGLSENEARQQGIACEVARYGLEDLDRAIVDGENRGLVKVLTVPGKDRILGAAVMGYRAGEMIAEFALAMRHGIGLDGILGTVHAYPTMPEGVKYAAGVWKKSHAPRGLLKWIERFHAWRRC